MLRKCVVLLMLFTSKIECGHFKFRLDYTFSEEAEGWLKLHRVPAIWSDARFRCTAEGAVLASPLTIQRQKAILRFVSNEPVARIYTGVHATFSQGDYASVEGVALTSLPIITWAPGEPDNKNNLESCLAMMTRDGTLADVNCNEPLPYVCFKKQTELSISECGTYDKEYKLNARTGSCYKFHRNGLTWEKAYSVCASEEAYLAIINSQEEATILAQIWGKYGEGEVFARDLGVLLVGIRDSRDGGSWMTIHGQTPIEAGYNRWGGGQPDNSTGRYQDGESCGTIFKDGVYNDICCCETAAFICEKKPIAFK